MLSDDHPPPAPNTAESSGFQTSGRGQKHRLDDDQMSTGSNSKRQDLARSAEKNPSKNQFKSQSKSQFKNKPKASK